MPSARIELSHGRSGICGGSGIDRTKPAALQSYMDDKDWKEFCKKVDVALEPTNLATRISKGTIGATFLIFLIIIVIFVVGTTTCFGNHSGYNNGGPIDCGPNPALFFVPVVMIFVSAATFCYAAIVAAGVQREIQRICEETSSRQPQLSFHVRYERHYYRSRGEHRSSTTQYIEVSINRNNNSPPDTATLIQPAVPMGDDIPIANAVALSVGSPAERLAELEKMKQLITGTEFEAKRAEILASL